MSNKYCLHTETELAAQSLLSFEGELAALECQRFLTQIWQHQWPMRIQTRIWQHFISAGFAPHGASWSGIAVASKNCREADRCRGLASFCHRVCFAFWNLTQSCGVFSQLVMYYYVKDFFNIMFVQNVSCAVKMWQVMKYDSLSCFTNRYCPVKSNLHTLIYHDAAGKARKWQGRSRSKKEDCCQAKLGIII